MNKKIKILLICIFIAGGAFALRSYNTRQDARKELPARRVFQKTVVNVMPVEKEDLNLVLSYVGSLKAQDEAGAFSKVSGKLIGYEVKEGDRVAQGDVIAWVDRDETGLKYEAAPIESPIAGIIGRIMLDKGASIQAEGTVQGTAAAIVVNMDEMLVELNIAEQDIPYFSCGLKAIVTVDAYPAKTFEGEVSQVSQIVDSRTRTLPVEIKISNVDHRLKSGMFGRIFINAFVKKGVLVVSQDALIEELGQNYVFVADGDTARKQRVSLGIRDDGKIEITDGVKENEMVIVFGQQGLKDGALIKAVSPLSAGEKE